MEDISDMHKIIQMKLKIKDEILCSSVIHNIVRREIQKKKFNQKYYKNLIKTIVSDILNDQLLKYIETLIESKFKKGKNADHIETNQKFLNPDILDINDSRLKKGNSNVNKVSENDKTCSQNATSLLFDNYLVQSNIKVLGSKSSSGKNNDSKKNIGETLSNQFPELFLSKNEMLENNTSNNKTENFSYHHNSIDNSLSEDHLISLMVLYMIIAPIL